MSKKNEFQNLFDTAEEETLSGEVVDTEESESLDSFLEMLSLMESLNSDDDNDDNSGDCDDDNGMDADDYHNKACDDARRGNYTRATNRCIEGLKRYPKNIDLIADTIQYSSKSGDMRVAETHYYMLRKLPFTRWNWRAFTFCCDYLLTSNPIENENEIRLLVKQYKTVLPHEEKAYMAESELEQALGHHEQSMNVLTDAIQHYSNAPQCALRLADMQFERGRYADVVDTCNYGLAASAEPQPSINIPYLLLLRVMAKDHLLIMKTNHETVKDSEVNAIREEYKLLLDEFPHQMMRHSGAINERCAVLKFICHEE